MKPESAKTLETRSFLGDDRYPLLMRINNPLAILKSNKVRKGELETTAKKYCTFEFYYQGIYHGVKILQKLYHDEKATTIEKIIYRYARQDQDLKPFVQSVSKGYGFRPRQKFYWTEASIHLLVEEIARYQNKGRNPRITPELFRIVWDKLYETTIP